MAMTDEKEQESKWIIFVQKSGTHYCKILKENLSMMEAEILAETLNSDEKGSGYYYTPEPE